MLKSIVLALIALPVVFALTLTTGCETNSAETIIRDVTISVGGFYSNNNGADKMVAQNTGAAIYSMNIIQSGSSLQAVDNNGSIYRGQISNNNDDSASFTMTGKTTAGQDVTVAGNFNVPVGSSDSTMQGSWIEPSLFSTITGQASVTQNTGTDPGGGTTNTNQTVSATFSPLQGILSFWTPRIAVAAN